MHCSAVIGVVTARLTVSTMPLKRTTAWPGPVDSESMRPSITPRGVTNFWLDRIFDPREARLVALHHRHLGRVVHEPEVGGVDAVLRHLLPRGVDGVGRAHHRGPLGVTVELGQVLDLPHGRHLGVGVVPGEAEVVALDHRVGAERALLVHPLGVGDVDVHALGVEPPAVERADDLAALHRAAVAEVGAEVRAERVLHVQLGRLVAPRHEVPVEVEERLRLAGGEVLRVADAEPAEGHRER